MENIITKWNYNPTELKESVLMGKKLLMNSKLTKDQYEHIRKEVLIIEGFLLGN